MTVTSPVENYDDQEMPDNGASPDVPVADNFDADDDVEDFDPSVSGASPDSPDSPEEDAAAEKKGFAGRVDAVKNILFGKKTAEKAAAQDAAAATKRPPENVEAKPETAEDVFTNVPAEVANHPAYKALQERAQIAPAVTAKAERFGQIENFMESTGVNSDMMAQALNLTALAVQDEEAFFKKIGEIYEDYAVHLGKKLPADIQAMVDDGAVSDEAARQLAQERAAHKRERARAEQAQNHVVATQQQNYKAAMDQTVNSWIAAKSKTDPGFFNKIEAITGEILRLQTTRAPARNVAEMTKLMDEAHENVTKRMRPARQPHHPAPNTSMRQARPRAAEDLSPYEQRLDSVSKILARRTS